MSEPRILFVAMQNSVHAARWIAQIADLGWDLHLFPIDHSVPHPALRNVVVHRPFHQIGPHGPFASHFAHRRTLRGTLEDTDAARPNVHYRPILPLAAPALVERIISRLAREPGPTPDVTYPRLYGPAMLARAIRQIQPDLVHSLEFQHCGYRLLEARTRYRGVFPRWLATNWGSDIFHFANQPAHRPVIERLLAAADFYSCECERDVGLAHDLGFKGTVLPVLPNSAGFDLVALKPMREAARPSARDVVLVKGYQHFAGRALTALAALERVSDALTGKTVAIYSAAPVVTARARKLQAAGKIRVELIPPHTPHAEMLGWHARARIYLGISAADAISTSLLEAMVMGAFPVQTNTSCCTEWIEDGVSGFAVPVDDEALIADRLRRALSEDCLVDRAAELNWNTALERLERRVLLSRVRSFYEAAMFGVKPHSRGRR